MGQERITGCFCALALLICIVFAHPAFAAQLYVNELFESYPNLQVLKEGQVMRTVEWKVESLAEDSASTATPKAPRQIALTFDDGPDRINTPKILDILRDEQVRATFFVLGEKVERFPDITRRIYNEGHLIANHSHTHTDLAELTNEEILVLELEPTSIAVERITGYYPLIMRPPYGSLHQDSVAYLRQNGWQIVRWSLDTFDWDSTRNSPEEILERIMTQHHHRAIVLMHCNGPTTIQALPEVIKFLREMDYEFVTVNEL